MNNKEVAKILDQTANILEIKGENEFRVRAYRQAAENIENLAEDVNCLYQNGKIQDIPGIGKGIADYIGELMKTGTTRLFEKLKKQVPLKVLELLEIEGLGPKKVKFFYQRFKIKSVDELEKFLKSRRLNNLKGWGERSKENILKSINFYQRFKKKFLLGEIYPLAKQIVNEIKESGLVEKIEVCGSVRRWKETIGDLDILVVSKKSKQIIKFFTTLNSVKKVLSQGLTKAQVLLKQGLNVDLRVVNSQSFGAAIHYFTGSKDHNIHIRRLGLEKGLRINEYGIFKKKKNKLIKIGGQKEIDVFKSVGLPWIPPEIREDRGEIEAGQLGKLPRLINFNEIYGDCHLHTTWSDGRDSILDIAKKAKEMGYKYIAITDHATEIKIIKSINTKNVNDYLQAIETAKRKIKGIEILKGIEVDIKKDGQLFLPDEILKKFDLVIVAVHSNFNLSESKMTDRIIKALDNYYVNVLAHPTGTLLNKREPYQLNIEKIIEKAKQTNTFLEINAYETRLDLNAYQSFLAKKKKAKIIINTDAHSLDNMEFMKLGIATARRGWLEKEDVINAWPLVNFLQKLKKKIVEK